MSTCPYCDDGIIYDLGRCKKHTCFGHTYLSGDIEYLYICDKAALNGRQCDDCSKKQINIKKNLIVR